MRTLLIEGMMCAHCQAHVTDALNAMEGVSAVVDQKAGTAVVTEEREVSESEYKAAIEAAGYTLKGIQ
ncbi:MAG TPA: cation transporter [Lachnospiraceae bacterium]|jgi:copper chaperone CopZ|nr:cation transporter [Lachnospiraceae bacterium]